MMQMSSTLSAFLEDRSDGLSDEISCGHWFSGLAQMQAKAKEDRKVLVGVWSKGDDCTYSTKLEQNFMTDAFKSWMLSSDCYFWFGHSMDPQIDDRKNGKAWTQNQRLSQYPFMRVYWTNGSDEMNVQKSGNEWNGRLSYEAGAEKVISMISAICEEIDLRYNSLSVNPELSPEETAQQESAIARNGGYCPSEDVKSPATKCPCQVFKDSEDLSVSPCGLYVKRIFSNKE